VKPDFSGEWVLDRQASNLSGGAAAMESGVMSIDHRDPKCGFRMDMSAGGPPIQHAWEISADGTEVAGGGGVHRLFWEGDTLVFDSRFQTPPEPWTMSWRYELLEEGRRLRAVEQIRGSGRDQDNTWIFDRR
jgi:hypothetical protein